MSRPYWKRAMGLAMSMVVALGVTVTGFAAQETEPTLTILHTNDMHGSVIGSDSVIGLDRVAAMKQAIPNSILVDAGDATQGGAFAALTQGADVIRLMNEAGYDAMTAGNHEFDYGREVLLENQALADFPILSANTVADGKLLLEGETYQNGEKTNNGANIILEKNGVKVGLFGITTCETANKTNPSGLVGITFEDEVETAKEQIAALQEQGAQVIIGVFHVGVDPSSEVTTDEIAAALKDTGIHAIIDGHSHTVMTETMDGIVVNQTGTGSRNIGRLDVYVENGQVTVEPSMLDAATINGQYEPLSAVTQVADEMMAAQEALLEPVIGKTTTTLWGGTVNTINEARLGATNMGSLIADAMVASVKERITSGPYADAPVVALENGGGVRATIQKGDITVGDVINVLPFGNTIAFKAVTPKVLYEVIENGVSNIVSQDPQTGMLTGAAGAFPQISGFRFTYNPDLEPGSRVVAIYLDGEDTPLDRTDDTTQIVLASNDYEVSGGDGYTMLAGQPSVGEGGSLDAVVREYITDLCEASPEGLSMPVSDGRIQTVGSYEPKNYSPSIVIKDSAGNTAAGAAITYAVDGGEEIEAVADEQGVVVLENLTDGPHTVSVNGADDVLVNNYSGAGIAVDVPVVVRTLEAAVQAQDTFTDIEGQYQTSIEALLENGVIRVNESGLFRPADVLTRAEFVAMLASMSGDTLDSTETEFADVEADDWYAPYVAWAEDNGIVVGDGERFYPNAPILRQDMAVIIAAYAQYKNIDLTSVEPISYSDAEEADDYAEEAVLLVAQSGVMVPADSQNGLLEPQGEITRGESAVVVENLLELAA